MGDLRIEDYHRHEKPEGFHDADNSEGICSETVDRDTAETSKKARRQRLKEWVSMARSKDAGLLPKNSDDKPYEGDKPQDTCLDQYPRELSVKEVPSGDSITKNRVYMEVLKDRFPPVNSDIGGTISFYSTPAETW